MEAAGRRQLNGQLVRWLQERAAGAFAGELSLVVSYGSHWNGTAGPLSDVDCYFVPKTERGQGFGGQFILQEVGYDIFPLSWERLGGIARLEESLTPLVGDAQVLYYGDQGDLERFRGLERELRHCLGDGAYCREMAGKRFDRAWGQWGRLKTGDLCSRRLAAGLLLMDAAEAVAFANGTYFHRGLKGQFADLQAMAQTPEGFLALYQQVIQAGDAQALEKACGALLDALGGWLGLTRPAPDPAQREGEPGQRKDAAALGPWYEELSSTFQKLRSCQERGDWVLAFLSAVCLQRELEDVALEYAVPRYQVLDAYRWDDLGPLVQAADRAEAELTAAIRQSGGIIKEYDSWEDFLAARL